VLPYLGVFLATAGVVAIVTPLVRLLSVRVGAVVQPADRMMHPKPMPTMGGLALLVGVLAGMGVASLTPAFRSLFTFSEAQGVIFASLAVAAVGVIDDLRTLSAPAKVAGQILAAGLLVLNGVVLVFFYFPTQGTVSLGSDLATPLTILWVLIVVNAVNLIDGLDGLAAGTVGIAAAAFFFYAYSQPSPFAASPSAAPLLAAIAAGAAIGFLPYNFHPARIIMGDTGSMLLGLLLAAATIVQVGHTTQPLGPTGHDIAAFALPVLVPFLVLLVPLVDVVLAIVRRLVRRRPWYAPDKQHIHHQLMEIGHSHRMAVLLMYLWSSVAAGATLAVTFAKTRTTVAAVAGFALLVVVVTIVPGLIRAFRRGRVAAAAEAEPAGRGPRTG
jgi:UDP-GlcNAc:undecaprenyl-phosphate GlcNAc-1-phosphate transferase